jgi:hypothetical protein
VRSIRSLPETCSFSLPAGEAYRMLASGKTAKRSNVGGSAPFAARSTGVEVQEYRVLTKLAQHAAMASYSPESGNADQLPGRFVRRRMMPWAGSLQIVLQLGFVSPSCFQVGLAFRLQAHEIDLEHFGQATPHKPVEPSSNCRWGPRSTVKPFQRV